MNTPHLKRLTRNISFSRYILPLTYSPLDFFFVYFFLIVLIFLKQNSPSCSACMLNCLYLAAIQHKYDDWKDFLVKRLTGARTLPHSFYSKVQESLNEHPIKVNMKVEVVDKTCVSAMRVATVDEIIGGRLRLQYVDNKV